MEEKAFVSEYRSPCGTLLLISCGKNLVAADWADGWHRATIQRRLERGLRIPFEKGETAVTREAARQLDLYFAGSLRGFRLPLLFLGTDFQKQVWSALQEIPYGGTVTYSELAAAAGNPRAVRAAGTAVGENPFSVIVPCHRVVGKSGALTGYGGGLEAKRYLLSLEKGALGRAA